MTNISDKIISKINSLNDSNSIESYSHIKNILKNQKIITPFQEFTPFKIIRYRRHHENESFLNKINDLSYRRDILNINSFGRCNEPGQGLFYCNDENNENTGLAESLSIFRGNEKSKEEKFTIGAWYVKSPLRLAVILPSDTFKSFNSEFDNIKQQSKSFQDSERFEDLKKLVEFLAQEFTLKDSNYKITCAFSNYIKEIFPEIDGIKYGSVKSEFKGTNIVLWPEVVEKKLKFAAARKLTLTRIPNNTFIETYSKETQKFDINTGKILW